MKKIIVLILMSVMALCLLVGCGKEKKRTEADYVGNWLAEYEREEDNALGKKGDPLTCTIELYKGGTGRIKYTDNGKNCGNIPTEWEMTDDDEIIKVSYGDILGDVHMGLEYNADDDTLIRQDKRNIVFHKQ